MLFVNEEDAVANGMTHEGRLYGVRVWYCEDEGDSDAFYALPFFSLSVVWLWIVDCLIEFMCLVTDRCVTIEPEMVRKLQKQSLT